MSLVKLFGPTCPHQNWPQQLQGSVPTVLAHGRNGGGRIRRPSSRDRPTWRAEVLWYAAPTWPGIAICPAAVSILDRLLHHATVVITDGPSYRMKDAQHRKEHP